MKVRLVDVMCETVISCVLVKWIKTVVVIDMDDSSEADFSASQDDKFGEHRVWGITLHSEIKTSKPAKRTEGTQTTLAEAARAEVKEMLGL